VSPARRLVQRVLPAVVSGVALVWLFATVDARALVDSLSWRVLAVMVPALLAYGAATLLLEALSVLRLVDASHRLEPSAGFDLWTAARIKCASYLLAIVNYTLGAGALAVLLRRQAGVRLAEAAGLVIVISSLDLAVIFVLAGTGAALGDLGDPTVRRAVLTLAVLGGTGFVFGLLFLRAPGSFGPLERIRSLALFEALRLVPLPRLAEVAGLRVLFSLCFLGIGTSAFVAFEIHPSLGELVVGIMTVGLVGAVPIAVAGLGTTQAAVLVVFRGHAEPGTLLAMSLVLSAGLISLRALMGAVFAREFTRAALEETRETAP